MSKRPVTAARPTTPRLSAPADAPDLLLQLGDRAAELAAAQDKLTRCEEWLTSGLVPPRRPCPSCPQRATRVAQEVHRTTARRARNRAPPPPPRRRRRRLTTDSAALDGERQAAASLLSAEREKFADVKAVLERALEEQTARAEGLQRALADAQQQLSAAQAGAAAAAAAAEQRHAAEIAQQQAVLDSQRDRMQQVEALLAERDALRAQAEALQTQVENDRHALHRRIMVSALLLRGEGGIVDQPCWRSVRWVAGCQPPCGMRCPPQRLAGVPPCQPLAPPHTFALQELERQHALDREVWRQDTALAVQQVWQAAVCEQRALCSRRACPHVSPAHPAPSCRRARRWRR